MHSTRTFHSILILLLLLLFTAGSSPSQRISPPKQTLPSIEKRLHFLAQKAEGYLPQVPIDSLQIPRTLSEQGRLHGTGSKEWTSGFYSGTLWQLYRFSHRKPLQQAARTWMAFQEKEKRDYRTHDLGFKIFCSYGEAFRTDSQRTDQAVILEAAKTLSRRFNPVVGAIRSWDHSRDKWGYPVIIDNLMNLDLLFAATRFSGDSLFYQIARQHAATTLKNHYRPDGSSYHVVNYDTLTGKVLSQQTHQGAFHESAWARGQAWGLYGFAMAWRETRDPQFLHQAEAIAEFIFTHPRLPKDKIPYWDFDAPGIPRALRDVSAAAIAACGLLILCEERNRPLYLNWADEILHSLAQPAYQSNAAPFFLAHSVGNLPADSEVDVPIIYADYYYVEALLRRLEIAKN